MPIQDLEDQPQLTNGLIKLHDIFPTIQTQARCIFVLHMATITLFSFQTKTHHHTANSQIMEFKIHSTVYKNPTTGTLCHTTHKYTSNNCHNIVLGHLILFHMGGGADSALLQIVFITSVREAAEPRNVVTFPKI